MQQQMLCGRQQRRSHQEVDHGKTGALRIRAGAHVLVVKRAEGETPENSFISFSSPRRPVGGKQSINSVENGWMKEVKHNFEQKHQTSTAVTLQLCWDLFF